MGNVSGRILPESWTGFKGPGEFFRGARWLLRVGKIFSRGQSGCEGSGRILPESLAAIKGPEEFFRGTGWLLGVGKKVSRGLRSLRGKKMN